MELFGRVWQGIGSNEYEAVSRAAGTTEKSIILGSGMIGRVGSRFVGSKKYFNKPLTCLQHSRANGRGSIRSSGGWDESRSFFGLGAQEFPRFIPSSTTSMLARPLVLLRSQESKYSLNYFLDSTDRF